MSSSNKQSTTGNLLDMSDSRPAAVSSGTAHRAAAMDDYDEFSNLETKTIKKTGVGLSKQQQQQQQSRVASQRLPPPPVATAKQQSINTGNSFSQQNTFSAPPAPPGKCILFNFGFYKIYPCIFYKTLLYFFICSFKFRFRCRT